jgi:hypothetical protein
MTAPVTCPAAVVNRCCGDFDSGFASVSSDQNAIRCMTYGSVLPNRTQHGTLNGFADRRIDDSENLLKRTPRCLDARPARHAFRDGIKVRHITPNVGAHDAVTNRIQRRFRTLFFPETDFCVRHTLNYAGKHFGE